MQASNIAFSDTQGTDDYVHNIDLLLQTVCTVVPSTCNPLSDEEDGYCEADHALMLARVLTVMDTLGALLMNRRNKGQRDVAQETLRSRLPYVVTMLEILLYLLPGPSLPPTSQTVPECSTHTRTEATRAIGTSGESVGFASFPELPQTTQPKHWPVSVLSPPLFVFPTGKWPPHRLRGPVSLDVHYRTPWQAAAKEELCVDGRRIMRSLARLLTIIPPESPNLKGYWCFTHLVAMCTKKLLQRCVLTDARGSHMDLLLTLAALLKKIFRVFSSAASQLRSRSRSLYPEARRIRLVHIRLLEDLVSSLWYGTGFFIQPEAKQAQEVEGKVDGVDGVDGGSDDDGGDDYVEVDRSDGDEIFLGEDVYDDDDDDDDDDYVDDGDSFSSDDEEEDNSDAMDLLTYKQDMAVCPEEAKLYTTCTEVLAALRQGRALLRRCGDPRRLGPLKCLVEHFQHVDPSSALLFGDTQRRAWMCVRALARGLPKVTEEDLAAEDLGAEKQLALATLEMDADFKRGVGQHLGDDHVLPGVPM
jgi:hypothetical protein